MQELLRRYGVGLTAAFIGLTAFWLLMLVILPNITLFEHHMLVDLITSQKLGLSGPGRCLGLYALNEKTDEVETFSAPHTMARWSCGVLSNVEAGASAMR